ncbi:WD40-repeat-containing domain protein [Fomitopsis serialis]|uniref:WD40-repeat-containing domain protein n=1 Tax=Fomitopsis serialis TaxID=139415 RepID=UPI002008A8C6|nr:WD40-repeat-containing domain protein [Neoantrodia serialis]KAH9912585.1 WD40-repeat-containing domain protein [Neoantrodia serialis]
MATPTLRRTHRRHTADEEPTPRFSNMCTSVLGSPFLTTSDLPPESNGPRASTSTSAAFTLAYSNIEMEPVDGADVSVPRDLTVTRPPSPSPSFRTDTYSVISWNADSYPYPYMENTPLCGPSGRRTVNGYYPYASTYYPNGSGASPMKPSRSLSLGIIPRIWDALREGSPGRKGKRRPGLPTTSIWRYGSVTDSEYIDYLNLPPLDGEEGELIDDEACFIDATRITGTDIVGLLPPEIALHLLSFLDLQAVLACLRVSRTWNRLCRDNSIWRSQFVRRQPDGWDVDLRRAPPAPLSASKSWLPAPLELEWYEMCRTRAELDRRWSASEGADGAPAWEPKAKRLSGHMDSVYCLEFDSRRIVTGSRDRTIKVWSLTTGRCLATFTGHRGSVLCLKFDKDWDFPTGEEDEWEDGSEWKHGFMVSGSSDCSVCVWDLCTRSPVAGEDGQVKAEIAAVLRGHTGGVLDLRIDSRWIVSCSKDALIRVWDRRTLQLHCTFRGHEGPVNAVGLQDNKVASASGDGRMMLWDIISGERLRTFEGHDRGLACIEFKDDYIISGSNDCKIKVWQASTGACLRTLAGHDLLVRALSFDPRSGLLVSASYDKTVKVWDWRTGKMLREFRNCHNSHIFDVKFDFRRIVSTSHDQKIIVLDFAEGLDVSMFV